MNLSKSIRFLVFSYNRGKFLENVVRSILKNVPGGSVLIVDDNSNDAETVQTIECLREYEPVEVMQPVSTNRGRHGGLYNNMQSAFEFSLDFEFLAFLQDDTQIVRNLDIEDLLYFRRYFGHFPNAAFLNPRFLMGLRSRGIKKALRLDESFQCYFYNFEEKWKDRSVTQFYTDISVAKTSRLLRESWGFLQGESTNAAIARTKFGKMGQMTHPFVANLPLVPFYRGKRKSRPIRVAESRIGSSPKSFKNMSNHQVDAMRNRDLQILPFAEDFLETIDPKVPKPYQYKAVNAFPFLRLWNRFDLWFARIR